LKHWDDLFGFEGQYIDKDSSHMRSLGPNYRETAIDMYVIEPPNRFRQIRHLPPNRIVGDMLAPFKML
jgi:hypothetical protein